MKQTLKYINFFETSPHDDNIPEHTCYCECWCSAGHRFGTGIPSREERKGITKQLLQYACQDAANDGFDYVEVYPEKEATDELKYFAGFADMYKNLGFTIHGESEQKFVMRKQLKSTLV